MKEAPLYLRSIRLEDTGFRERIWTFSEDVPELRIIAGMDVHEKEGLPVYPVYLTGTTVYAESKAGEIDEAAVRAPRLIERETFRELFGGRWPAWDETDDFVPPLEVALEDLWLGLRGHARQLRGWITMVRGSFEGERLDNIEPGLGAACVRMLEVLALKPLEEAIERYALSVNQQRARAVDRLIGSDTYEDTEAA